MTYLIGYIMKEYMKVTALLTGKGNNTLKNKNILDCLGHPVMFYPAQAGNRAHTISSKFCSSDDSAILKIANDLGYISIIRPQELSRPESQHIDCILHALEYMRSIGDIPDILVVLLANNVSVKSEWIDECVEILMADQTISSVVPIYKDNDHHPLRAKIIGENGRLQPYEKDAQNTVSTNRQDLSPCYFLAHNFWVLNVNKMLENPSQGQKPWSFMGDNIAYLQIDESIDIHSKMDLILAEEWVRENYIDY